jgi:ClpX C4-type zinc finger
MVTRKKAQTTPGTPPVPTLEFFTVFTGLRRRAPSTELDDVLGEQSHYCTFCGKGALEVETMITAPDANICGDCVELCRDIVGAHRVTLSGGVDTIRSN